MTSRPIDNSRRMQPIFHIDNPDARDDGTVFSTIMRHLALQFNCKIFAYTKDPVEEAVLYRSNLTEDDLRAMQDILPTEYEISWHDPEHRQIKVRVADEPLSGDV